MKVLTLVFVYFVHSRILRVCGSCSCCYILSLLFFSPPPLQVSVQCLQPRDDINLNLATLRLEIGLAGAGKATLEEDEVKPIIREIFKDQV